MTNILIREDMKHKQRLYYILSLQAHIPSNCPDCQTTLTIDHEQVYCPRCGLITQDSYNTHAGKPFILPHGLRLG